MLWAHRQRRIEKKAEEAVQAAKAKNEDAQRKYQNAQDMDMNKETGREVDREFVLNKYKDAVDNTAITLSNAEKSWQLLLHLSLTSLLWIILELAKKRQSTYLKIK